MTSDITRDRIAEAESRIRPHVRRTPTVDIDGAEVGLDGVAITLKLELLQHAGSFKARGAFANLVGRQVPRAGVAAASGGNHGAAVAYAAMRLGVPARVFVPEVSSAAKVERIRGYGADLVIGGARYADALAACERWAAECGALTVHAFDDEGTLLGQGTLGMELQSQAPSLDTILLGVGGGGLAAGVAAWYDGAARVVGVEPECAPTLERALAAGRPVDVDVSGVAVDSLGARRVGDRVFPIAQRLMDGVVLVDDAAIRRAQAELWRLLRVVAEPGGAAAFASLLSRRYVPRPGERVGVVVSGGNTVAVDFSRQ